ESRLVLLDRRGGILLAKPTLERRIAGAEAHRTDAAPGGADEQPAERARGDGEVDQGALAVLLIGRRRHAELRIGALVEPRRRAVAGVVERAGDVLALAQPRLDAAEAPRIAVFTRADAELALEQALQLVAADAERGAELGEAGRAALALVERAIDQAAGATDLLTRRVARRLLMRTAAQA